MTSVVMMEWGTSLCTAAEINPDGKTELPNRNPPLKIFQLNLKFLWESKHVAH